MGLYNRSAMDLQIFKLKTGKSAKKGFEKKSRISDENWGLESIYVDLEYMKISPWWTSWICKFADFQAQPGKSIRAYQEKSSWRFDKY